MNTKEIGYLNLLEEANNDSDHFTPFSLDKINDVFKAGRPFEWRIRTAKYFGRFIENDHKLFAVTRYSQNAFIIDFHHGYVKPEEIRLGEGKFRWNREPVLYEQRGANLFEVNSIYCSFPELTAGQYAQMSKVFIKTLSDSLEVGKTGRNWRPLATDSIVFPK